MTDELSKSQFSFFRNLHHLKNTRYTWYRIATLGLVVTVAIFAIFGPGWYRAFLRQRAISALSEVGGTFAPHDGPIHHVVLTGPHIGDDDLERLAPHLINLQYLTALDLVNVRVTDDGLMHLKSLKQLQTMRLFETEVTDRGADQLRQAIPKLEIERPVVHPMPIPTKMASRNIFNRAVLVASFNPSGSTFATGHADGRLCLWSARGSLSRTIQAHTDWLFSLAFSPDGEWLATGGGDNQIRIWKVDSAELIAQLDGHVGDVHGLAFGPSHDVLYSAADDHSVRIWNVIKNKNLSILEGHEGPIPCLAVDPNRKMIATGSRDDTIRIWDASRGRLLQILKGHTNDVMSLAFSPNGRTLASASYDRTVRLWDVESGEQLASLMGHTDWVFAVAFHPDGKTLVSGGGDATIRYWDVDSQREVQRLRGQMNVSCVTFAPGGNTLASTAADGNVILRDGFDGSVRRVLWMPATDRLYPLRRQSDSVAEIASEQPLP